MEIAQQPKTFLRLGQGHDDVFRRGDHGGRIPGRRLRFFDRCSIFESRHRVHAHCLQTSEDGRGIMTGQSQKIELSRHELELLLHDPFHCAFRRGIRNNRNGRCGGNCGTVGGGASILSAGMLSSR